jgi:hypothetical protein
MTKQDSPTTSVPENNLASTILNEWLIHDEYCSSSLFDKPCDCIQSKVIKNIMPLIESYGNHRELEGRLSEIKLAWNSTQPDIVPSGWEPDTDEGKYIVFRIEELSKKREKHGEL